MHAKCSRSLLLYFAIVLKKISTSNRKPQNKKTLSFPEVEYSITFFLTAFIGNMGVLVKGEGCFYLLPEYDIFMQFRPKRANEASELDSIWVSFVGDSCKQLIVYPFKVSI